MTDKFVPLTALTAAAAFQPKVMAQAETRPVFSQLRDPAPGERPHQSCAAPAVTVQRQGDIISGIRVECGCGQVIELACSY
ncbi:MAG TPA: hypothetical protein VH619_06525 [Verrucomicrobiae bacterium]|jgi:hypothetical protein|nr:hypothetical protein [Verrucomicrobiae bacterium]